MCLGGFLLVATLPRAALLTENQKGADGELILAAVN